MDPITVAVKQFQQDFCEYKDNPDAWVLRVVMEPKNVGTLEKALRAEEWSPENQSPFLIFDRAYTHADETFDAMRRVVVEHYRLLQKAFDQEGTRLPDFGQVSKANEPAVIFIEHLRRFVVCTREVLTPPFVCWLPTDVRDKRGFQKAVVALLQMAPDNGIRFVFVDEIGKERLDTPLNGLDKALVSVPFEIDEAGLIDYFKKMMSPPSKGRFPGTLPGSAAPDVEPPQRPGPKPPTEEEIKAAIAETGAGPILTVAQAEQLRQLVFEAATATGQKDEASAITRQREACDLCASAGVKLEEVLMTLVLANYLLQFGDEAEAEKQYRHADALAGEARAYPQLAQVRMALGYLLLKNRRIDEAAHEYEQAAAAAVIGGATLLYFESLRMAGTCHLQRHCKQEAYLCWKAAVEKGKKASADEIRVSSFLDVAGALIKLLKDIGLIEQAKAVETIVVEVGKKSDI